MCQSVSKCRWRCVPCSSQGYYTPKCTNMHKQHSLNSNPCEVKRAAGQACHANINKPTAVIPSLSHLIFHHIFLFYYESRTADYPTFLWFDVWVQVCMKKHNRTSLFLMWKSQCYEMEWETCMPRHTHTALQTHTHTTHLVPFRMPGILPLLVSHYFPSPHTGSAGQQINYATQHNAVPTHLTTGKVLWDKRWRWSWV